MPKYIDADAFVKEKREWYCEQCQKRKGMKRGKLQFVYEIGGAPCRACDVDDVISDIEDFPAADVEPKQRWIPVTERLPKVGEDVLVFAVEKSNDFPSVIAISDRMIFRLFPSSEGVETWRSPWQYFMTDYEITHWMPLPEPPKEEKSGEDISICS